MTTLGQEAVYFFRGISYYSKSDYKNAIVDFNQALKLEPNHAEGYYTRGSVYSTQGNYTQAIVDYNQALKLKPDYAEAYYKKACAYSLKKEFKAAIENLRRAIDLYAKSREVAKTDSDFDNIREDKQFRALVGL